MMQCWVVFGVGMVIIAVISLVRCLGGFAKTYLSIIIIIYRPWSKERLGSTSLLLPNLRA